MDVVISRPYTHFQYHLITLKTTKCKIRDSNKKILLLSGTELLFAKFICNEKEKFNEIQFWNIYLGRSLQRETLLKNLLEHKKTI